MELRGGGGVNGRYLELAVERGEEGGEEEREAEEMRKEEHGRCRHRQEGDRTRRDGAEGEEAGALHESVKVDGPPNRLEPLPCHTRRDARNCLVHRGAPGRHSNTPQGGQRKVGGHLLSAGWPRPQQGRETVETGAGRRIP